MHTTTQATAIVPVLSINLSEIPALLDANGVRKHLAPLGRTLLYELATRGEIQTASIGMKRGKRVFVTASVVQWLQRRMAATQRPQMADRRAAFEGTNDESFTQKRCRRQWRRCAGDRSRMVHFMKSTNPMTRRLGEVLDDIHTGKWRPDVDRVRAIRAKQGKDAYNRAKENLPSFYISGTASKPTRMLTHSGMIQVDLDDLGDRLAELRAEVETDSHGAAVFISPGGGGLKIIFRIAPLDHPLDMGEHKRAVAAVSAYFVQRYGVTPDPQCKNVNRHCLVSCDPDLYRNPTAVPFDWKTCIADLGEERGESSSQSSPDSLCSLPSPGSLTFHADTEDDVEIFDPQPIRQAFALAHPELSRLYEQLLGRRQRPKQRERNKCAVDISTFLLRVVSEPNAMLMQGHWYDLYHRGRFRDTREQHLQDAKVQWKNALIRYVENLGEHERRRYYSMQTADLRAAFRILRDCALSPRDEPPPNLHMSWRQLALRLGVHSDRAGDIFDAFIGARIMNAIARPVMYGKGATARSTRYRWLLPTR